MRLRQAFWPRGLAGRTVLLLLASLTVFHFGSLWIHRHDVPNAPMGGSDVMASATIMAIGIVAASVLLARWMTRPLRRLAKAADRIGRERVVALPQDGPEEVQRLAHALEAMQTRITRLIDDRTQALAAVSHDLRTPITRMRLRTGFLEDPDVQARMDADLDEMESMIEALLAYLQGDVGTETPERADIGALLSTLCDAATDAGGEAHFDGPSHFSLLCRPVGLRRALSNLIANGMQHAGAVRVSFAATTDEVHIIVDDDGPGIPEDELERVFEPFYRLEASRNRSTGGVGLGLAICRQAIAEQGGQIILHNKTTGGLRAIVRLPYAPVARTNGRIAG